MKLTDFEHRQQLVDWARKLQTIIASRDGQAADQINKAIELFTAQRFTLTILGKAKRGKSTLVNAMLGRHDDQLAPIDKLPASNVISRFSWAQGTSAKVHFRSEKDRVVGRSEQVPFDEIRNFVTEEGNPNNTKQVEVVEIQAPFVDFAPDLILVDTPGAGSIHEHHDALLHAFIPSSDAVLFLVTARMPLDQDELDLLKRIQAADIRKVIFAINKVDATNPNDLDDAIQHNMSVLREAGINVTQVHRISAKAAFQGDHAASGLSSLTQEIGSTLRQGKADILVERFQAKVLELVQPVLQGLRAEVELATKSDAELNQCALTLSSHRQRLEQELAEFEKTFSHRWNMAISNFSIKLPSAREALKADILGYIKDQSNLKVGKLTRDLPSLISKGATAHLEAASIQLETDLQKITQELQTQYSTVDLGIPGVVGMAVRSHSALVKGGTAGALSIATGGALVAAANTAAAGSVAFVTAPSILGGVLAQLIGTTGGLVTTTAVPAAIPAWVLMAGPIGWTLGGVGLIALPFAWTLSRSKQKAKLEDECIKQIDEIFRFLKDERVPVFKESGQLALMELRTHLESQLTHVEAAINNALPKKIAEGDAAPQRSTLAELESACEAPRRPDNA